jgi:hypothetical protein
MTSFWSAYHDTGTERLHHPVVGDLELSYEVMELTADTGPRLAIFTAEPGTRSDQALNLLARQPGGRPRTATRRGHRTRTRDCGRQRLINVRERPRS